jgi:hypothetical protein
MRLCTATEMRLCDLLTPELQLFATPSAHPVFVALGGLDTMYLRLGVHAAGLSSDQPLPMKTAAAHEKKVSHQAAPQRAFQ